MVLQNLKRIRKMDGQASGSLDPERLIFFLFLAPLLRHKPRNMHAEDWLEMFMCLETRHIDKRIATSSFHVPARMRHPSTYFTGLKCTIENMLHAGEMFLIRRDTSHNTIEMEMFKQPSKMGRYEPPDIVIPLSHEEYEKILQHSRLAKWKE